MSDHREIAGSTVEKNQESDGSPYASARIAGADCARSVESETVNECRHAYIAKFARYSLTWGILMASARWRSVIASSNDIEANGTKLRGNTHRRETTTVNDRIKPMIAIADISGPI